MEDGGYENRLLPAGRHTLVKQYQRAARFHSEARALDLLGLLGLSPRALGACEQHRALLTERVDARPLAGPLRGGRDDEEMAERLGALLRQLHSTPAPGTGPLNEPSVENWPHFLRRHLATRLKSLPLNSRDGNHLWAYLNERLSALGEVDTAYVLHHDLKPANILCRPDDGLVLCDFDHARGGDPLSDLGKLWWRTFAAAQSRPWQVFLRAYGRPDDERTQAAVAFYLIVHCVGALAYWHDHTRPGYLRHACSARQLLAAHTGVRCSLQIGRRESA
ncbi:phosphotransferase family protein [Streptomyces celluloflavus]|uniref:phosphotransferase family protein n=1 Tax=Streptomyces celluloflavus TaxID=58344 RepID=UPI0034604F79|nr:aminoglycoside phosphotransferase family protein [Streptomyces celluloflavus]